MAGKIGSKGIRLVYALYMVVIVVNSLRNAELFEGQAFEYGVQDTLVLGGNSRASTCALDSIFSPVETMSS
jgi:hypothetical protein